MAVVLLKGLLLKFPMLKVKHILGDKGYDCAAIYQLIHSLGAYPAIALIHHKDPPAGMNLDYTPVCAQGHAYRYDSFDAKYETLKYTRLANAKAVRFPVPIAKKCLKSAYKQICVCTPIPQEVAKVLQRCTKSVRQWSVCLPISKSISA